MVGFIAFDFVLGLILARVVDVSFVIHVLRMHLDDSPADPPGLRVPAYTIMQLESFFHIVFRGFAERHRTRRRRTHARWAARVKPTDASSVVALRARRIGCWDHVAVCLPSRLERLRYWPSRQKANDVAHPTELETETAVERVRDGC